MTLKATRWRSCRNRDWLRPSASMCREPTPLRTTREPCARSPVEAGTSRLGSADADIRDDLGRVLTGNGRASRQIRCGGAIRRSRLPSPRRPPRRWQSAETRRRDKAPLRLADSIDQQPAGQADARRSLGEWCGLFH
jgi:hypothetical protein